MAQFENMFRVDLDNRSYPVNMAQMVSEGNVSANRIGAYVYKDGQPYNLGGNCTGMVMRADGTTVPLTGVIDGNAAYVVLDQPSCAIPGPIQVAVNWVSGSNTTTLIVAYGTVIHTDTRNYVEPGTPIPDINTLLAAIEDMETATAAANAAATKAVRYDTTQSLTDANKTTARGNIDAAGLAQVVRHDASQSLTETQKSTARGNIGAASDSDVNDINNTLQNSITPANWFNPFACAVNMSYNKNTGEPMSYENWVLTDFIEVPIYAKGFTALNYVELSGEKYRMSNQWVAQFDANKKFIGSITSDPNVEFGFEHALLSNKCRFIRTTTHMNQMYDAVLIFDVGNIQISALNVFPLTSLNIGGVIGNDGNIVEHSYFGYTDFIPVPKWANRVTTYNVATLNNQDFSLKDYQFATYDSNKIFIENVKGNTAIGYVSTPINAEEVRYIRVDFGINNIGDCVVIFGKSDGLSKWDGKTGDFLGDSITAQNQYTAKITELYGIVVNNYGVSGTTISNIGGSNYFATRINGMNENCDFIFMLGGTNDWGLNAPLGTKNDKTVSTFYGGLYVTLNALREKFPTKPIFISTILQRDWQSSGQPSGIDSNSNGNSIMEFNDAIIYMAHRFGCVVFDGFGECGICISNITTYCSDRLHLNATGGTRYATFIKDCMEQYSPY
jgi:hypothetical protein